MLAHEVNDLGTIRAAYPSQPVGEKLLGPPFESACEAHFHIVISTESGKIDPDRSSQLRVLMVQARSGFRRSHPQQVVLKRREAVDHRRSVIGKPGPAALPERAIFRSRQFVVKRGSVAGVWRPDE